MKIGVMVAAVAALFGFSAPATSTPTVQPRTLTPTVAQCLTLTRSFSYGMTDPSIADLQEFLGVRTTGYFGPLTRAALIVWQVKNGIISSAVSDGAGIVGPKTRVAMRCGSGATISNLKIASSTPRLPSLQNSAPTSSLIIPAASASATGGEGQISTPESPCPPPIPQPAASLCTVGEWVLIHDEAGCLIEWDCSDQNAIQ